MANVKDLSGMRFGKLVAVKLVCVDPKKGAIWECRCDCGNTKISTSSLLQHGYVKSCGCIRKTKKKFTCSVCGKEFYSENPNAKYCSRKCKDAKLYKQNSKKVNKHKYDRGDNIDPDTDNKQENYRYSALSASQPLGENKYRGISKTYYSAKVQYFGRVRVRKDGKTYAFTTDKYDTQEEAYRAYLEMKQEMFGMSIEEYLKKRADRDKRKKEYKPKLKYRNGRCKNEQ